MIDKTTLVRQIPDMECSLCQREAKLCDSHIIPEFMYKPVYDSKHRMHSVSSSPDKPTSYEQKGLREKLLCSDCEQYLGRFENYAKRTLTGENKVSWTARRNYVEGFDYHKFKLFQMSLLWRAGISGLPFFSDVSLGPHEERLRRMILAEDAGEPHEYGCIIYALLRGDNKLSDDIVFQPGCRKMEGHTFYRFLMYGLWWLFVVSSHSERYSLCDMFLTKQGKLTFHISRLEESRFFYELVQELKQASKLDLDW